MNRFTKFGVAASVLMIAGAGVAMAQVATTAAPAAAATAAAPAAVVRPVGAAPAAATVAVAVEAEAAAPAAAPSTPAEAVEARQHIFEQLDELWQPLLPMMRGKIDPAAAAAAAADMIPLAEQIPAAFELDTRDSGIETEAMTGIWDNKSDFDTKAAALVTQLRALQTAGEAGNERAVRTAMADVGRNGCAPCHDSFRAD